MYKLEFTPEVSRKWSKWSPELIRKPCHTCGHWLGRHWANADGKSKDGNAMFRFDGCFETTNTGKKDKDGYEIYKDCKCKEFMEDDFYLTIKEGREKMSLVNDGEVSKRKHKTIKRRKQNNGNK